MGLTCDECGETLRDGDETFTCEGKNCNSLFCATCAHRMKKCCPNCGESLED